MALETGQQIAVRLTYLRHIILRTAGLALR